MCRWILPIDVGAILNQVREDGQAHLDSTIEKECLAIKLALDAEGKKNY